ncbi:MAG: amidohydrolase family protein [Pirellulales bacterium]
MNRRRSLQIGAMGALGAGLQCIGHVRAESGEENEPAGQPDALQTAARKVRIWDGHGHLGSVRGKTPTDRMARLIEYADRMGVERLVVFMGWPFVYNPSPDELRRQNDQILEAIHDWPDRVFGYAYVNPNHIDPSLEEMERCIVRGPMVGIKLWVAKKCNDPALDPIVHMATKLQVPIYQHTWLKITGNLPGESTPSDLAELAGRHPEAKLICGHAGGDWEHGIRAIRRFKNVLLETAGGDPTAGVVEMAVRELGAERVLYGSDVGGRSFASQLAKVQAAEITGEEKERILGANLRGLLAPILAAKGIAF